MGASIIASASDVLAFARHALGNTAMQKEQARLVDPTGLGRAWGLGWILDEWGGVRIVGHDGNSLGQNAFMRLAPDHGFGLCLQTNVGSAMRMWRELAAAVFEERFGPGVRPAGPPSPDPDARIDAGAIAGTYERESLRIVVADGPAATFSIDGIGKVPLRPVDGRTFLVKLPIADDEITMTFFDLDGRSYLHFGGRASLRVG